MHARQQILNEIKTALDANAAFSRVYLQRRPPTRQLWPALCIFAENETAETMTIHNSGPLMRELQIAIKGFVRPGQDDEISEAALDSLAVEIEKTLTNSSITGEKSLNFLGTVWDAEIIGDMEILTVVLTYVVSYTTVEYLPETLT